MRWFAVALVAIVCGCGSADNQRPVARATSHSTRTPGDDRSAERADPDAIVIKGSTSGAAECSSSSMSSERRARINRLIAEAKAQRADLQREADSHPARVAAAETKESEPGGKGSLIENINDLIQAYNVFLGDAQRRQAQRDADRARDRDYLAGFERDYREHGGKEEARRYVEAQTIVNAHESARQREAAEDSAKLGELRNTYQGAKARYEHGF